MSDRSETPYPANEVENRSLKEIIQHIAGDVQSLIQAEVRLARTEISQKITRAKAASFLLGAAAFIGFLGAACLVTTCIALLGLVLPIWAAALIIGIILCGIAGGAFAAGRTRLQKVDLVPQRTVQTLKDDVEWAKHHAS